MSVPADESIISSMTNKVAGKGKSGGTGKEEAAVLVLAPVHELAEKLRQKSLVTKDELIAITSVLTHSFGDVKSKGSRFCSYISYRVAVC